MAARVACRLEEIPSFVKPFGKATLYGKEDAGECTIQKIAEPGLEAEFSVPPKTSCLSSRAGAPAASTLEQTAAGLMTTPRRGFLWLIACVYAGVLYASKNSGNLSAVLLSALLGSLGCVCCMWMLPMFATKFKSKGLWGRDLNKQSVEGKAEERQIPEGLGLVPAVIFLLSGIASQLLLFGQSSDQLLEYNAGLLSICLMTFLGFADDVLELPWRYKMILPLFASMPLLVAYRGRTEIVLPEVARPLFWGETTIHLGWLYYVYMAMLTIFCTNSINIYAGINGLEVGQSVVMCFFLIVHNVMQILYPSESDPFWRQIEMNQHMFSLVLSLPFFGCSVGLLCFNWYPSLIFVGDTYTYFAGMYFAVAGIFGHFSKTLLLLFIPQVINFLMSVPQLFGLVQCPRHRVPKLNPATGKLEPSPNFTLINVVLRIGGPMHEKTLVKTLLFIQVTCCFIGLSVRLSPLYKLFL